MKIICKSYKLKKNSNKKWVLVLNNYNKKRNCLTVINMPVSWKHSKNYVLNNQVGQWRIKKK